MLKRKEKGIIFFIMRRDKTLKISANHYITLWIELKPKTARDWVWNTRVTLLIKVLNPNLWQLRS